MNPRSHKEELDIGAPPHNPDATETRGLTGEFWASERLSLKKKKITVDRHTEGHRVLL